MKKLLLALLATSTFAGNYTIDQGKYPQLPQDIFKTTAEAETLKRGIGDDPGFGPFYVSFGAGVYTAEGVYTDSEGLQYAVSKSGLDKETVTNEAALLEVMIKRWVEMYDNPTEIRGYTSANGEYYLIQNNNDGITVAAKVDGINYEDISADDIPADIKSIMDTLFDNDWESKFIEPEVDEPEPDPEPQRATVEGTRDSPMQRGVNGDPGYGTLTKDSDGEGSYTVSGVYLDRYGNKYTISIDKVPPIIADSAGNLLNYMLGVYQAKNQPPDTRAFHDDDGKQYIIQSWDDSIKVYIKETDGGLTQIGYEVIPGKILDLIIDFFTDDEPDMRTDKIVDNIDVIGKIQEPKDAKQRYIQETFDEALDLLDDAINKNPQIGEESWITDMKSIQRLEDFLRRGGRSDPRYRDAWDIRPIRPRLDGKDLPPDIDDGNNFVPPKPPKVEAPASTPPPKVEPVVVEPPPPPAVQDDLHKPKPGPIVPENIPFPCDDPATNLIEHCNEYEFQFDMGNMGPVWR